MLGGCGVAALIAVLVLTGGTEAGPASGKRGAPPPGRAPNPATSPYPPAAIPLASGWQFRADWNDVGRARHWETSAGRWRAATIPSAWNGLISNGNDGGRIGWYRVRFRAPPALAARTWEVRFDGVRRNADVWLNGVKLGSNDVPYVPFTLSAKSLRPRVVNTLVVRVDNNKGPNTLPEDWWNWGGIVRAVTLQPVGRIALADLGAMPELGCGYQCGNVLVQGVVRNLTGLRLQPQIAVKLTSPSGQVVSSVHPVAMIAPGHSVPISFHVRLGGPPALWSPSTPNLYGVQVTTSVDHRVEQVDTRRVGMRNVSVNGGILYLNGQRLWLHGAAIHEDVYGRGPALSDGDIFTIVSELRSLGANVTRAHYLLDPRLLTALDTAGIMVWEQAPVDHADQVISSAAGRTKALAALRATLLEDRSHPSVIVNSVGNELTPTPDATPATRAYLQQAIPLAHRLDPASRVGLDVYGYPGLPTQQIYSGLDVLGISDYFGWYAGPPGHSISDLGGLSPYLQQMHASYPGLALVAAEFGAEALYSGPVTTKGTYEFQANYFQQTLGVVDQLPFMNGAIYWTLREFAVVPGWVGGATLPPDFPPSGVHRKGLLAYDGTAKPAFGVAQKLFAQTPSFAVH